MSDFSPAQIQGLFGKNFHVRHREVFEQQKDRLVLVKGSLGSHLVQKAELMSEVGKNLAGKPLEVISFAMQEVFGNFNGKLSFQRSPTRWVDSTYVARAAQFVKSLN